jgi:hypothetical protein
MPQLFAEFGVPAGGPPPLLLGADRRDEPYADQAAEHPVQGTRRDPCLLGPLPRPGFPQDLMPVHLPPAEHSEHEGPGGRDRRHTITQYGGPILGLSIQAASDCSPRQIRSRTRMHSIRHHPASVGTQIRHFGRGATGHGSDQDAALRRDCARLPPVSWLLPAIGSADTTSVRSLRHWRPRLLGWPTGWDPRVHGRCPGAHLIMQMRMVARSALTHKYTVGPARAGLGNRDWHTAQRALDNRAPTRRSWWFGRSILVRSRSLVTSDSVAAAGWCSRPIGVLARRRQLRCSCGAARRGCRAGAVLQVGQD